MEKKKVGDAGFRTQDLLHAKQTLYRWATSPPGSWDAIIGSINAKLSNTVILCQNSWPFWSSCSDDRVGEVALITATVASFPRWGCSSAVEHLLCKQKILGSKPSISNFFPLFVSIGCVQYLYRHMYIYTCRIFSNLHIYTCRNFYYLSGVCVCVRMCVCVFV